MLKARKISGALMLVAIASLVMAACNGSKGTPTKDPQTIYTEAAVTVAAGLTQTAMTLPTATATETLPPTSTPEPTQLEIPTSDVTNTTAVLPTATSAAATSSDRAEWVSNSPSDGTTMYPGQKFTLTWVVRNIGTTTWSTSYTVRCYLGTTEGCFSGSNFTFPKEVAPNDTVELTLSMAAPSSSGDYTTDWVMTNADGVNFYPLTLQISVEGSAPTATHTKSPATSTPEATETSAPTDTPEATATP